MTRTTSITAVLAALAVGASLALSGTPSASAATASQFDPGYIISDELFYDGSLATVGSIDAVIQAKGANCTSTPGNPGCLKQFRTDTPTRGADAYCREYAGAARESAATVIVRVGQACGINPQALLVLLEKESGLVSRNNPSSTSYKIAMGYGCPDTAACDTRYYGYFNQLYSAARQFKVYQSSNSFNYRAGRNNQIYWHPNAACGSSTVFIQNKATAGLYNYTPYRPNTAAMSNLYGSGDACSSYGNRNFWRIFTDWFGSPTIRPGAPEFVKAVYEDMLRRSASESDVTGWGRAITNGMPTSQVAFGFTSSDEFRLIMIDAAYRGVLDREPEPDARRGWLQGMRDGALGADDIARVFYATDEFYVNAGRGTDEGFVAAIYPRILNREAGPEEVQGWAQRVRETSRSHVVASLWNSAETARKRVARMYDRYLGRVPDAQGLIGWGDHAIVNGDAATRSAIIGSLEYWNRASARF